MGRVNVGELARPGHVTLRTLHRYEAIGLLPAPQLGPDQDKSGSAGVGDSAPRSGALWLFCRRALDLV